MVQRTPPQAGTGLQMFTISNISCTAVTAAHCLVLACRTSWRRSGALPLATAASLMAGQASHPAQVEGEATAQAA
jgi:hypothetical protein